MRHPTQNREGEVINGRCYMHGGHPDMGMDSVEDAADAQGIYTQRSKYYQKLPPNEQIWVDKMVESFVNDAPFDEENLGKMEVLRNVAVDLHKIRRANNYIDNESMAQEVVIDTDDSGRPIKGEKENIMNLPIDRLERSTTKRLKDLGVVGDDPESAKAEATESLAEVLSGETSNDEQDGSEGGEQ